MGQRRRKRRRSKRRRKSGVSLETQEKRKWRVKST
jgi:hypothetical protein